MPRSTARVHAPTRITKSLTFKQRHLTEKIHNSLGYKFGWLTKTVEGDYYGFCRTCDLEAIHEQ